MAEPTKREANLPSGSVDNRDVLKPGEWDRGGAGELASGEPSTVGTRPKSGDEHTSAGN